jgi:redox-sensitive bicupin YhaK (pirin superfamily)
MIEIVINARRRSLGGFEVGRVLPWTKRRMVGPFIFFDHIGPVRLAPNLPREADVRPHPHIGLSTITYLFAGEMVHRDSLGFHQVIRPGEVNWMTAGRGISHSERFETMREKGGLLHGIQAWIALPLEHEEIAPAFVHFDAADLPQVTADGVKLRVIGGSVGGQTSPLHTYSPLLYAHVELDAGATMTIAADDYPERAVFVASGSVQMSGETFEAGQMLVLEPRTAPQISALAPSTIMLLGGEPVGPRHIWWNFVASSEDRIERAKAEWRAGKIPLPVDDNSEFIPLPQEPPPPPEPMS